jgi:alpha-galactosidase/6-phospho-beta-glucosidase family protein
MLNVDKNYSDSSYIDMYWKNNINIDQSKTRINKNRNLSLEEDIKKELLHKLNKNKNKHYKNTYNVNRVHNYNNSNVIIPNTYNKYYNQYSSNKTQYRSNYKKYNKDNNEYGLQTNCRIKEYNLQERKILLDSFSKPKLLYESNIKN